MSVFKLNFTWTFFGNAIYSASQWGMLSILSKMMNVQTVGQFALALAITSPIFAFLNLQIKEIQVTDVNNQFSFDMYFGFRIITTLIAILIIILISFTFYHDFSMSYVLVLVGLIKAIDSLSDIIYSLFQKFEVMSLIAKSMIIKSVFSLFFFYIILFKFRNINVALFFCGLMYLFVFIFYDLKKALLILKSKSSVTRIKPAITYYQWRQVVIISLPLGIVVLLNTLNFNIPRYFIENIYGVEMLGYYSAIAYALVIGSTVVNAIGQSALPKLAKYYSIDIQLFNIFLLKMLLIVLAVGLFGVLSSVLFGELLLKVLYTEEYAFYSNVLIWTMIGATSLYCSAIIGCAVSSTRKFYSQLMVGCVVTSVIIISCFLLIPKYGLIGGAIALFIGYSLKFIGQSVQILYLIRQKM